MRRRHRLGWFVLVLIFSGTPARQAEAASDLARTMAELDEDDRRIEEADGGVGDDSLEATRADDPGQEPVAGLPVLDGGSGLPMREPARPPGGLRSTPSAHPRWPTRSGRRQAWLGRFLC